MSRLPAWGRADLPEPLPLSFRNALRTIGPGAILLAASIGGGEWLVGPAVAVKHGIGLFWIATLAIVLQTIFNLEAMRYTLYTGEPIVAGFMRLRPSSRFWATIYSVLSVAQLGMPALGAASATPPRRRSGSAGPVRAGTRPTARTFHRASQRLVWPRCGGGRLR